MDIDKPRLIYVSLKHVTWRKKVRDLVSSRSKVRKIENSKWFKKKSAEDAKNTRRAVVVHVDDIVSVSSTK